LKTASSVDKGSISHLDKHDLMVPEAKYLANQDC